MIASLASGLICSEVGALFAVAGAVAVGPPEGEAPDVWPVPTGLDSLRAPV